MTNPRLRGMRSTAPGAGFLALALAAAACGGTSPTKVGGSTTSTAAPTATSVTTTAPQPGTLGPEAVPIPNGPPLAPVNTSAYPQTIDGVECQTSEQVVYHIHAHLTLFADGKPRQVPYAIGIAPPIQVTPTPEGGFVSGGTCFYWLHTHAADGIIHIESPTQKVYTLGQFFDVWGQPLTAGQVGPATGTLTTYVNGQPYSGNPRDIPLTSHGEVQIDVGAVVAPEHVDWSQTGL